MILSFARRARLLCILACLFIFSLRSPAQSSEPGWPTYGGDPGGSRYSAATQLTPENVTRLQPAWIFHTHALDQARYAGSQASFETTPVLADGMLFFTSPFDQVFAVDAFTGRQLWTYEPKLTLERDDVLITSRGVALWGDPANTDSCAFRVLLGTLDARLIALDGHTGVLCAGFGDHGTVDLKQGIHFRDWGGYGMTSPPTVLGNVVVVGSSVVDNHEVGPESGLVRAFDTVTGRQLWQWGPIPWGDSTKPRTGAGNVWSVISADPQLGLVYLPTGSAAPDYFGGLRKGNNQDANSVVALDIRTGRKVWAFQVVHHDIWDYDVASEPVLFTWLRGIPALAITTKNGQVFILDRRTGVPLAPVVEKPMPHSDVAGEQTSLTQPISGLPPLTSDTPDLNDSSLWVRPAADIADCERQLAGLRTEGLYTPVSERGTLLLPGNLGGVNWGGAAVGPGEVLYASVNREPFRVRLIARASWMGWWLENGKNVRDWPIWIFLGVFVLLLNVLWQLERRRVHPAAAVTYPWLPRGWPLLLGLAIMAVAAPMCLFPIQYINQRHFGYELSPQEGTPYMVERKPLVDSHDLPCASPPWGSLVALDLVHGTVRWRTPLGSLVPGEHTGMPTFGGPVLTAGGLLFAGGADDRLRALNAKTGEELWSGQLPASARATPMTYILHGRQFIVIAAGGHGGVPGARGDSLVAFALPEHGSGGYP